MGGFWLWPQVRLSQPSFRWTRERERTRTKKSKREREIARARARARAIERVRARKKACERGFVRERARAGGYVCVWERARMFFACMFEWNKPRNCHQLAISWHLPPPPPLSRTNVHHSAGSITDGIPVGTASFYQQWHHRQAGNFQWDFGPQVQFTWEFCTLSLSLSLSHTHTHKHTHTTLAAHTHTHTHHTWGSCRGFSLDVSNVLLRCCYCRAEELLQFQLCFANVLLMCC